MLVIGLTGGIGSGKSAVSQRFENLGITVVDADIIAREVVGLGSKALSTIAAHFGDGILLPDGALNRPLLRQKIFSDSEQKQWLEQLLHPLIGEETLRQLSVATGPYVIYTSPLLLESGQEALCEEVVVVDISEDLQLSRTMGRDSNEKEQVQRIIASQIDRPSRLAKANHIIDNSGDISALDKQVQSLHQIFLSRAKQSK
ncbi:MAG: dephospho-CoA kinase [Spongiibacteraceae bacterium]